MFEENKKEIIIFLIIIISLLLLGLFLTKGNIPQSATYIGDSSKLEVYTIQNYVKCNTYIRKKHMTHFNELDEAIEQGYKLIEICNL